MKRLLERTLERDKTIGLRAFRTQLRDVSAALTYVKDGQRLAHYEE